MKQAKSVKKMTKSAKGGNPDNGAPPFVVGALPLENEQHEFFCQELLMMKPQVRAYQRAYPETCNTYGAASASAGRLLEDARIQERLKYLKEERSQRLRMTADDIHERLVMAASFDPAELYDSEGQIIPLHKLPPEIRLCIESVEYDEIFIGVGKERKSIGRTGKIKSLSKGKALELLGRHQKMFTDNLKISGRLTLEQLVAGSMEEDSE